MNDLLFHSMKLRVILIALLFLVSPALLQIAPALGGVAEIEGANGAKSNRAKSRTFIFIDLNTKF